MTHPGPVLTVALESDACSSCCEDGAGPGLAGTVSLTLGGAVPRSPLDAHFRQLVSDERVRHAELEEDRKNGLFFA